MTYLSGRNKNKRNEIKYFVYVGILILLSVFWLSYKQAVYPVLEPVVILYSATKTSIKSIPLFFETYTSSRKSLIERTKVLEVTVENLENQIAEKDAKLNELKITIEDVKDISSGSVLVMYPLVNDVTRIYSTILLSKGYKDGVEKDDYVYVRGLQPVCVIKEVYTSTSKCELLSAGGVITEAVVEGGASSTSIVLTLTGRGGGTFLGDVARDTPISVGSKVLLKGDHSMTLGTVVDVLHNNQDTSWHVFVRGAYNPVTSSIFYLIKK